MNTLNPVYAKAYMLPYEVRHKVERGIARYDGWHVVALVVLLALAATVVAALMIWCLNTAHGSFTGNFSNDGWNVNFECEF